MLTIGVGIYLFLRVGNATGQQERSFYLTPLSLNYGQTK